MHYSDFSIITDDVRTMRAFYERVLCCEAEGDDTHVLLHLRGTDMAIYSRTAAETDMGFDFSQYDGTGRISIAFAVQDVDEEYARLQALGDVTFIAAPKTYPWGARSMHFRDPDGNIICLRSYPHLER